MTGATSQLETTPLERGGIRSVATRLPAVNRVTVALGAILLLSAVFYVWTAATSIPFTLHGGLYDRYNLLASAFLHLRVSVGRAPAALLHLANPYNPAQNEALLGGRYDASSINDDILYHGRLYFVWGPAPALVLLVPLHLLGFEPSGSVTTSVYAIAGLGFALGTLRVVLRQIGGAPLWMCILAGLALALSTAIPFILRTPSVTEDALAGGFCFTMAGIWLASCALVARRASRTRLLLMSLCFGLAAGSRPALALTALMLIPVYLALRGTSPRRALVLSLGVPVAICFVLLLAYNQARFGQPLQIGSNYQLTGVDARTAPLGRLSYALPGAWLYASTPPQLNVLFPFVLIGPPRVKVPAGVAGPEITGGLLPMAPIVVLVPALLWLRRRRPALLGRLAVPFAMLAGVGTALALLAAYEFFSSTERYEVDFAGLFVLGGVVAWLALSQVARGGVRSLVRVGGGALVVWGCVAGLAISFIGYGDYLEVRHPGTWRSLEDASAPLSTLLARVAGHPVIAAVSASHLKEDQPLSYLDLGAGYSEFSLGLAERARVAIVSPYARTVTLLATEAHLSGARYGVRIAGGAGGSLTFVLPRSGARVRWPVALHDGLNRLTLAPVSDVGNHISRTAQVVLLKGLSIAGG